MQDKVLLDDQDQHPTFKNVPKEFWLKLEEAYQIFYDALARKDWDNLIPAIRMLREDLGDSPTYVPSRAVIDMEVVPHVIGFLSPKFSHNTRLQHECLWLLSNLAAGNSEDTMYLVEQDIIPILCEFFTNFDEVLQENIMWVLANISAENDLNLRDQILDLGGLSKVLRQLYRTSKTVTYNITAAWLIANLVRGEPFPEYKKIEECFRILADFVDEDTEDRIKYYSLTSLIYLTQEKEPAKLKPIFQMSFIPKIIKNLTNPREEVGICAIKVIMNLLETNENEFIYMKNHYGASIFEAIEENLMSNCSELRRESLILLNMLLSKSEEACEDSLDYDILPELIECIATDNEKMKIIASHCIYKIVSSRFFNRLANEENVAILIDNLSSTDPEFIKSNLLILNKLFEQYEISGHNISNIKEVILQQKKLSIIQSLEKSENDEIKEEATGLLKRLYNNKNNDKS